MMREQQFAVQCHGTLSTNIAYKSMNKNILQKVMKYRTIRSPVHTNNVDTRNRRGKKNERFYNTSPGRAFGEPPLPPPAALPA